jgi:hypothetical protein
MKRNLYSPRLSNDVIRVLYQEGQRRKMPMTRLADELILAALAMTTSDDEQATTKKSAESPATNFASGKQAA